MIGTLANRLGISNFTMDLLEGTGWYQITNRLYAHQIQFGKNRGCSFINNTCLNGSQDFCTVLGQQGVSLDPTMCGVCGTSQIIYDSSLPSYFNYFGSFRSAATPLFDNCPVNQPFSNRLCYQPDGSDRTAGTNY